MLVTDPPSANSTVFSRSNPLQTATLHHFSEMTHMGQKDQDGYYSEK